MTISRRDALMGAGAAAVAWEALETERFNFECLRLAGEARS